MIVIKPLAKWLLKRSVAKQERTPSAVSLSAVDSICIVTHYSSEDRMKLVRKYHKTFLHDGYKRVLLVVVFRVKKKREAFDAKDHEIVVGPSDFSFLGEPTSDSQIAPLLTENFDLLIDLTDGVSLQGDICVGKINAQWKAGRKIAGREYLLDLMIDTGKMREVTQLTNQINHYLKQLNH